MSNPKIITVAEAKAMKSAELAKGFVVNCEVGRKAYLTAAVMLIALTAKVGSEKATAMVKKEGATDSTVKNARQLVRVYEALVVPKHVTEEWFAAVQFMDAVAINAALAKKTAHELAYVWKKSVKSAYGELLEVADKGMTFAEREAYAERQNKKAAEAAKSVTLMEETTSDTPVTPSAEPVVAVTPAVVEPVKDAKSLDAIKAPSTTERPPASPMAEFEDKVGQLEKLAVGIIAKFGDDVTLGRIQELLVSLNRTVSTAIEAKTKKARKAA